MKHPPTPSHRERVALFRLGIVGDLLTSELARGELLDALKTRAERRYRPPGSTTARRFHYKTLQRWYYAVARGKARGLEPKSRQRGRALALTQEQREVLLAVRREHPSASAELILREAVHHGVVALGALSLATLRRLYVEAGLPRRSLRRADRADDQRRRWRTRTPGLLWQGDVCHLVVQAGPSGPRRTLYIHAFMDDHSRFVVALMACEQEREVDMLEVLCGALLKHPKPRGVFLDNGACYSGELFALICKRLDIRLAHAEPYQPKARGLQERFWETLRTRCLDHLLPTATLHDVNLALWAFLDVNYHRRPHGGLFGMTPHRVYLDSLTAQGAPLTAARLATALESTLTRHVRGDATFTIDAHVYEVTGRHLLGKDIEVVVDGLTGKPLRVTYLGRPVPFGLCDPLRNADCKRPLATAQKAPVSVPFNPIATLLQKAREMNHE